MSKPIAVLGTDGTIHAAFRRPTAEAFERTGANTGNLAFQYAAFHRVLGDARVTVPFAFDPAEVRERARMVCIPAANFLYSGFDLGALAERLEATGLPLLVLGLGAQAMHDIGEVKLQPGTERLLHLFRERCRRIMVRGRHTGAVLERQGVHNFEVLGCPSNFINPDGELGAAILARLEAGAPRLVAYAPTFYPYNAAAERAVLDEIGPERLLEIVAQDPLAAVALARGEGAAPEVAAWVAREAGFLSAMDAETRDLWLPRLRAYFSAESWLEGYRRVDAVIGTRIHGAALGWQAGRPALVISYDLRTEELAETMGLPFVKAAALPAGGTLAALTEGTMRAATAYDARRRGLAARLVALLGEHGVTAGAPLAALAAGTPASAGAEEVAAPGCPSRHGRTTGVSLSSTTANAWAGWVASSGTEPPAVTIRFDGREIGTAAPAQPRPDIGPNAWAFDLRVPEAALSRDVVRVEALFAATGGALQNSPVVTSLASDDAAKVLRGRGGFLFLRNDTNRVLDQVSGRRPLPAARAGAIRGLPRGPGRGGGGARRACRHLVAPNKECVLFEHLPPEVTLSEARPVRQLQALVARSTSRRRGCSTRWKRCARRMRASPLPEGRLALERVRRRRGAEGADRAIGLPPRARAEGFHVESATPISCPSWAGLRGGAAVLDRRPTAIPCATTASSTPGRAAGAAAGDPAAAGAAPPADA
jgi:hypothetical protein